MESLSLPFIQRSGLKWYLSALFLFCMVFSGAGSIIFLVEFRKEDPFLSWFFGLFFLALAILFVYVLFSTIILKRFFVEITNEHITVCLPLRNKTATWAEISDVGTYSYNGTDYITVLLRKDLEKRKKRTFSGSFNSLFGVPPYSFQIPTSLFKDIDIHQVLYTVREQINKTRDRDSLENSSYEGDEENNILLALVAAIISSLTLGTVYGISINELEKNYLIIPVVGSLIIISAFNRFFVEKSFNIIIRLLSGILCLFQIPIAIVVASLAELDIAFTPSNMARAFKDYCFYLFQNPKDQFVVIVIAIVCFGIGAVRGRVWKEEVSQNTSNH